MNNKYTWKALKKTWIKEWEQNPNYTPLSQALLFPCDNIEDLFDNIKRTKPMTLLHELNDEYAPVLIIGQVLFNEFFVTDLVHYNTNLTIDDNLDLFKLKDQDIELSKLTF